MVTSDVCTLKSSQDIWAAGLFFSIIRDEPITEKENVWTKLDKAAMNEKIVRFLEDAGFQGGSSEPAALQLLRFFEAEYDVSLLPLLEREWLDEQVEREATHEHFMLLREFIDEQHLGDYDNALARIEAI